MPALHIVVKLLVMMRLLLASLSGLHAYEFGYHPSAEEFDSLLRGTRSWTRNLLAEQQQREQFVPRFLKQRQRATALPWAAQKLDRPSNLLNFQMFSDELPAQAAPSYAYDRPPQQSLQVQSALIEISEPNKRLPATPPTRKQPQQTASSVSYTSGNSSFNAFPIFFSNPATGIVYAITEVGRADAQSMHYHQNASSGSITGNGIPIYVSKAQYDSDLGAMRQRYETAKVNCPTASGSTRRPQLVRHKTTAQPPQATNKLPNAQPIPSRPSAAGLIISNQVKLGSTKQAPTVRPTRRLKTKSKKPKKKKKAQKRPGRKPSITLTTPQIVRGTRLTTTSSPSPSSTADKLATQLEKPHMPAATGSSTSGGSGTIFSQQPIALSSGYIDLGKQQAHRLQRRSLVAPTVRIVSDRRQPHRLKLRQRRRNKSKLLRPLAVNSTRPTLGNVSSSSGTKKQPKRRGGADAFDFWGLLADDDEDTQEKHKAGDNDDDDDDDGENDDDNYDDDDSYYDASDKKRPQSHESTSTQDNSSSAEEGADFGAMEELPTLAVTTEQVVFSSSKNSLGKKRIRRRPAAQSSSDSEEYDDADDDEDGVSMSASLGSFFRNIFYPVQLAMTRIFDGLTGQQYDDDAEETSKPKYPTYTLYNNALNSQGSSNEITAADDDSAEEDNSLSSWLSTWFGLQRRTKKIASTTVRPTALPAPTEEPSWWESWFGLGKSEAASSDAATDDNDSWFFGWFDAKPKSKARRRASTSTTTSTAPPQVPILTIVDPLRNPQNWIGILAHHIANSTGSSSTSTHNPLMQALTRVTSTTESPETPRRMLYDKYQIWRLKPQDESQVRTLEQLKKSEEGNKLQWFKGPSLRGLTDVLVPPHMLIDLQGTLDFEGIAHEVLIFDVGKAIAYEQTKASHLYHTDGRPSKVKAGAATAPLMTWNKYYEHDDILKYLESIRMRHAQLVELIHIGRSYEGRPLVVVKLESKQLAASAATSNNHKRLKHKRHDAGQANAVFIEAGAHGLAWIAPAAATWMISELLRLMRANKTDGNFDFVHNTTWYIMPMLNPDGYVYSHEYDRFWKKTRSRHVAQPQAGLLNSAITWLQQKRTSKRICHGVDLDRNWLYDWGKRGSSKTQPCNEFYAGPTPFSEPETKALSEFLMDYRKQLKLYVSLQAYGQVVSYPSKANTTYTHDGRLDDLLDVAMVGTDVLRKRGNKARYKVDAAHDLIEGRSGCADAFAAYEVGVPYSYTLQLADNGVHGYLLPSSAIETTARDAFQIISGMLDYL